MTPSKGKILKAEAACSTFVHQDPDFCETLLDKDFSLGGPPARPPLSVLSHDRFSAYVFTKSQEKS